MADDFSVRANFLTTADTSGVEKLVAAEKAAAASARQLAEELDTAGAKATASQDAAQAATNRLAGAQDKAAGSARNMGGQMLQAGRIIQDFSAAGIAGITNNMEGLAMAMGLGGGVAGVATVLAVAIQALGPAFMEWLTSAGDAEAKLEDLKKPLEGYTSDADLAAARSKAFADSLEREAKAAQAAAEALKHEADMLKARNQLVAAQDANAAAQLNRELDASGLPEDEKARRRAAITAQQEQAALARREEERAKQGDVLRGEADAKERAAREIQRKADESAKRAHEVGVRQGLTEQTIPGLEEALKKAGQDSDAARNLPGTVPANIRDQARAEADAAAAEAKRRLDEATKARDAIAPGDAVQENKNAEEAAARAARAREEAARAREAANRGQARLKLENEADRTQTQGRIDDVMWQGDAAAAAASKAKKDREDREKERQAREAEKAARERDKAARDAAKGSDASGVMDAADNAAGVAASQGFAEAAKAVRAAVAALKDGATSGEVAQTAAALQELAAALNQRGSSTETREALGLVWKELRTLAAQIRNTKS